MSSEKRKKILHGIKPKKKVVLVPVVPANKPGYPPQVGKPLKMVRLDGLKFDRTGDGVNGDIVKDAKKGINVYCDGEFLRNGIAGIGNLPGDFFGQFPKGQARIVRKALRKAGFPRLAALPAYGRV